MSEVEQMPLEIWTDINGNATRTQFKGGVKYIRADERDRLRATIRTLCSSGNRLLDDLIGRSDAAESFKYHVKQAQAALTPAGGGTDAKS